MIRDEDTASLADAPAEMSSRASGAPEPEEAPIAPGDCLGRYTVRARLGSGGMGEVFAADDPELGRVVALKVLRADRSLEARLRFQREAQAMARLNHPNVVTVYDVGGVGERTFVAMELVAGPTLAEWLAERPRGWREVRDVLLQAGRGLEAAHAAGLVHRDFKPSNVLVGDRVRVADFGLARAYHELARSTPAATPLDGEITLAGGAPGTPAYLPPEQRAGAPPGPLGDQYSFAVALHVALFGVLPGAPAPRAAQVPRRLRDVIERGLRADPKERYPSMRELLADLARDPARSGRGWIAAAAGVALLAAGAVALALSRRAGPSAAESPLASARFSTVAALDGVGRSAAISRDGNWVAFLSDRDGPTDLWVTRIGSGRLRNLTGGAMAGLVNTSVRTVSFTPEADLVLFWVRRPGGEIGIFAVPPTGGTPVPYLAGAAELDWSPDGRRLAFHTPDPGDPLFVTDPVAKKARRIFVAPAGQHGHYPTWSVDGELLYFVQGVPPDKLDLWRMRADGGARERLTFHESRVSHPTPLDGRTLLYLATAADGSGPWLHAIDLEQRVPRRLPSGVDQLTSLASAAGGRRLVATVARSRASLWRVPLASSGARAARRIDLPTPGGRAPRLAAGYLLYVASGGEALWKVAGEQGALLWRADRERVLGGPAIARDGRRIAFVGEEDDGTRRLHVIGDGGGEPRVLAEGLDLRGSPAWAPDGRSITVAAVADGAPHLVSVALDGGAVVPLVAAYSTDPSWSPDGALVVYSGPDVGTTFAVAAVAAGGAPASIPPLTLMRGARRLVFVPGRNALVVLRGDLEHKDFWLVDLEAGAERRLTELGHEVVVRDFDVSPDGREIVFDRVTETSDVVLIER